MSPQDSLKATILYSAGDREEFLIRLICKFFLLNQQAAHQITTFQKK